MLFVTWLRTATATEASRVETTSVNTQEVNVARHQPRAVFASCARFVVTPAFSLKVRSKLVAGIYGGHRSRMPLVILSNPILRSWDKLRTRDNMT